MTIFHKTLKMTAATALMGAMFAAPVSANEVFSDLSFSDGLNTVNSQTAENLRTCLNGETSSKAVRSCSKSLKAVQPNFEMRSDLYTRRGLLYLSSGRIDKASRDFAKAARLDNDNEFAHLGDGYVALMNKDYAAAIERFNDCASHDKAKALAIYGRAMAKEQAGDLRGAYDDFNKAAELRPDWDAPREDLARFSKA